MPRKRHRVNYGECSSSDEENQDQLIGHHSQKGKTTNKSSSTKTKKGRVSGAKRQTKRRAPFQSKRQYKPLELEKAASPTFEDDLGDDFGEAARKRVDDFFKNLQSDEEDYSPPTRAPNTSVESAEDYIPTAASVEPAKEYISTTASVELKDRPPLIKDAAFYSLSEFEEDLKNSVDDKSPPLSPQPALSPKPSTSGFTTNKLEETKQTPIEYVASLLESSDESDQEEKAAKAEAENMSLEQLKKRTQEIVGEVDSYIKSIKKSILPKPPPTEIELPSCPVCLEEYGGPSGGPKQAMATLCGHIFCKTCITAIVASTRKCPTCRKSVNKKQFHPVYI